MAFSLFEWVQSFMTLSWCQKIGFPIWCIVLLNCYTTVSSTKFAYDVPKPLKQETLNQVAISSVAKANSDFTKKLYSQLIKQIPENDNLVVSPFSISSLLAMTLAGANGQTLVELRQGLSLPEDNLLLPGYREALLTLVSNANFTLDTANSLFVQDGFRLLDSYIQKVKTNYHADAVNTDFGKSEAVRSLINLWVEKKTNGRIKDLIKDGTINQATKLILVNAVYFRGDWATKFHEGATRKEDFTLNDGKIVQADMMSLKSSFRMAQLPEVDATALEMPYKGDRLSMIFILPNQNLMKTESSLLSLDLSADFKLGSKVKVLVKIPKFKIESSHDLKNVLKALGMTTMFDEGRANFSEMTKSSHLSVSAVVQKAFIEVNEQGSEAAASTAGVMMMRALILTPEFICNRPFLYLIKDNLTGFILFVGRVNNPIA